MTDYHPEISDPVSLPSVQPRIHFLQADPPLYPFDGHGRSGGMSTIAKQADYQSDGSKDHKSPASWDYGEQQHMPHMDNATPAPVAFATLPTGSAAEATTMANVSRYGGTMVPNTGEWDYTSTTKFKICFFATCVNVILFALDQLIITTAVPQIITEFESTNKLAYLNSAFFIPCAGFICLCSQFLMIWKPKWVFLTSILIFEAGCAVCGGARSMDMLIAGRAIAGLGGAGMWSVTYIIAGQMIPLTKRPVYFSMFGLTYIFASVLGPVVGGALTDTGPSGWRWCFYINLPIGGVAFLLLLWSLPTGEKLPPFDGMQDQRPTWQKFLRIDWIGAFLSMAAVTCFAIALQLGGVTKRWSDPTVIILLVVAPVCVMFLVIWTVYMGAKAQIPVLMLNSRHLWAGLMVGFFGYGMIVNSLYYIPLLLEAVHGKSAVGAGVVLIGYQISMCFSTVLCGKMAERTGHMSAPMITGSALTIIASGIILIIKKATSTGTIAGFLVLLGLGQGCFINLMTVAVQADYVKRPDLIPHATAVQNWCGFIGRIVAITTATSIFENKLRDGLANIGGLSTLAASAVAASPGAVHDGTVPVELQDAVDTVYTDSIQKVWFVNLGFACGCFIACLLLKRLNLKDHGRQADEAIDMQSYQGSDASRGGGAEKV